MLTKLITPVIFAAGAYKGIDKMQMLKSYPQIAATQVEITQIVSFMQVDSVAGHKFTNSQTEFTDYLKNNFKSKQRADTSLDFWNIPYRLVMNPNDVYVASNGPDLKPETTDDIKLSVELQP